jgi:hypothetical protein
LSAAAIRINGKALTGESDTFAKTAKRPDLAWNVI